MESSTRRILGPPRVVALAVILVLVSGLAYLRFGMKAETVTVPDGAQVGDLVLEPCSFQTESGTAAADCGTLVVPENWTNPQSRLIALPVIRVLASAQDPAEPVFYLEGGPGITNIEFERAGRFIDRRDFVMVGYRGVDGSVQLDCPEVDSAASHSAHWLGEEANRSAAAAYRACAERLTAEGVDLAGYGLVQRINDLESARVALGYDRIDLLSESAGTRTAMIYGWRHPEVIHRSVMIGVNPPGHYMWDNETTNEQVRRYADLCSQDAGCRARTSDLVATMERLSSDMPDRWAFLPIDDGAARVFSFFGIMESSTKAGLLSGAGAPFTLDAWLAAEEGDASGLWLLSAVPRLMGDFPWLWGERAAAARVDAEAARTYFSADPPAGGLDLGYAASASTWSGGLLADSWPAVVGEDLYREVRPSDVETLLIGGALDGSTPPQIATEEFLPFLPNGHQVVLPGFGHTASFYAEQPEAGTQLINTFFDSGVVDDSAYTAQKVDFEPDTTFTSAAKLLVGIMAGVALLAIAGLALMARRVWRNDRFGSKTRPVLRSLTPLPFGLGGWFFGALLVLATLEGVPLTAAPLVTISVGVPIGVGIFLAWVDRRWSMETKTVGLAVATAGSVLGAWLGWFMAGGIVSVMSSLVLAAALGNLAVLGLDIVWDSRLRSRAAIGGDRPQEVGESSPVLDRAGAG